LSRCSALKLGFRKSQEGGFVQDEAGKWLTDARRNRKNAKRTIDNLPNLAHALKHYRENINRIIEMAQNNSIRLLLITQPVLWRPNLNENLRELLWFGGVGDFTQGKLETYYSVDALSTAMKRYWIFVLNEKLSVWI